MSELPSHVPINRRRTSCAKKNDALGWKDGFSLSLEGVTFGIRSNTPELLPLLKTTFPQHAKDVTVKEVDVLLSFLQGGEADRPGVKNYHIVYDAWNRVARTLSFDEALEAFKVGILTNIRGLSTERTYLNASVVLWQDQAIVVAGESAQRTELIQALLGEGALCHGDQAVLNAQQQLCLASTRNGTLVAPRLAVFVSPGQAKSVRLGPARATLELLKHTYASDPARALAELAGLAKNLPSIQLPLGSPSAMAGIVGSYLS